MHLATLLVREDKKRGRRIYGEGLGGAVFLVDGIFHSYHRW